MEKKKLEVLLVEDQETHVELIRRSFKTREDTIRLTTAKNIQDAKNYLKRSTPDLVIVDYLLPDGKGTELLSGHKEKAPYPVIVMTSHGDEKIAVEAMKSGALDYIVKSREALADMSSVCDRVLREWYHIMKRRYAEAELKRQKEFSENLINSSVSGIFAFDINRCITIWNPGIERITGMSKAEAMGKNVSEVLSFLEETREDKYFSDIIAGKTVKAKDRQYFIPKTGIQGYYDSHYSPILNATGEIVGGVAIIIDTTEQKHKDRLLLTKNRQALMGEMISLIAHQWRQPLTTIGMITGKIQNRLLLENLEKKDFISALENIQNHIQYLSQTIDDFRNFFKPGKLQEPATIENIIEKSLFIIHKQFETRQVRLECVYDYKEEFKTYPNELIQVFLNILQNVIHVVDRRQTKNPKVHIYEYKREGFVVVEISDNAGGIPENIIDNIFLPYYSTNDARHGTGLGLYMSRKIIEDICRGEITAGNVKDGAKFTIRLPLLNL